MKQSEDHKAQIGDAAERKRRLILAELLESSSMEFIQKLDINSGTNGLDMNCGEGQITFLLARQIGQAGKMTGIDPDPVNIKIAEQKAAQSNIENVVFYSSGAFDKWAIQTYQFIFGRFLFSQNSNGLNLARQLYDYLKPGGLIMLEEMETGNYNCFPYSYAFERYKELLITLNLKKGIESNIGNKLDKLLEKAGFRNVQIQQLPPIFLKNEATFLPSLTFESKMKAVEEQKLASTAEIHALLSELKNFETQEDTLISLPGLNQVWGYKR